MTATEAFQAGDLAAAIEQQTREVRTKPMDHARRLFLFELLAFNGEFDRAKTQLGTVSYEDVGLEAATQKYRLLTESETARRRVYQEGLTPQFLTDAPEHMRLRLEAVQRLREGNGKMAADLLAEAEEVTPTISGMLNDQPFTLLRDADDILGPILEVMANGQYFWVPLEQVVAVMVNAPKYPRDLIWIPARLEMDATAGEVFLPTLYPLTPTHTDPLVKLGRKTEWLQDGDSPVRGAGARMFLKDDDAISLLDWRTLEVQEVRQGSGEAAAPASEETPPAST